MRHTELKYFVWRDLEARTIQIMRDIILQHEMNFGVKSLDEDTYVETIEWSEIEIEPLLKPLTKGYNIPVNELKAIFDLLENERIIEFVNDGYEPRAVVLSKNQRRFLYQLLEQKIRDETKEFIKKLKEEQEKEDKIFKFR